MKIFQNVMKHASKDIETPDFTVPKTVQRVRVEKGSNPAKLASEYTPGNLVITEYAVKGNAPSAVSEKYKQLAGPSGLSASYDEVTNEIALSWQYSGDKTDTQFNVTVSLNGGAEQTLTTTAETGLKMANPEPGGTYSFKVVAVRGNQQSNAAPHQSKSQKRFLKNPKNQIKRLKIKMEIIMGLIMEMKPPILGMVIIMGLEMVMIKMFQRLQKETVIQIKIPMSLQKKLYQTQFLQNPILDSLQKNSEKGVVSLMLRRLFHYDLLLPK